MRCLFYRWRISNALDRDAGGTGGEASLPHRHMERCPACRAYHQQCLAMGRALHAATQLTERRRAPGFFSKTSPSGSRSRDF